MALMTILMSLVFVFVGTYRGADLIQYLPFPVTAGFLAAIGAAIMRSVRRPRHTVCTPTTHGCVIDRHPRRLL